MPGTMSMSPSRFDGEGLPMSHPDRATDVETACPCCRTVFSADLWVVAGPGPEVDPATINRLRCPQCGHRFLAPTPLLWHDRAAAQAYVYLPAGLDLDEDDLVNGLLVRYMRGSARPDLPPDYLLSPAVYREAEEFCAKLQATCRAPPRGTCWPPPPPGAPPTKRRNWCASSTCWSA